MKKKKKKIEFRIGKKVAHKAFWNNRYWDEVSALFSQLGFLICERARTHSRASGSFLCFFFFFCE